MAQMTESSIDLDWHALSKQEIRQFDEQGYLIVRDVLDREMIEARHTKSAKEKAMDRIRIMASLVILATFTVSVAFAADSVKDSGMNCDMFNIEEILDESTLNIKTLEDWHVDEVTGSTRQKLIEIKVAEWWPGLQSYR